MASILPGTPRKSRGGTPSAFTRSLSVPRHRYKKHSAQPIDSGCRFSSLSRVRLLTLKDLSVSKPAEFLFIAYSFSFINSSTTTDCGLLIIRRRLIIGLRRACNLFLLIFRLLPTGIGVVFLHGSGNSVSLRAKILLVDDSIRANHKCLYPR